MLLAHARNLDCLVEITGTIEHGARIVLEAVLAGKHVILANAELDATIGPILKVYAQKSGVVISGCDGDQPGAELNLYRRVSAMGLRPLICGNIKGLQDYYRTPTTQKSFAEKWGQNPYMVTSFADGTKISFEQAIVANATGMKVAQRGMLGYSHDGHVDDLIERYDVDMLRSLGGIVDYTLGSKPAPGVFVFAECIDSHQHKFLDYFKMGVGPLYSFYVPYHLCHMEMPFSIARAVLFNDATITPRDRPVVEVIAIAKKSLKAGELLDRYGGYTTFGQCENAEIVARERLLPIGLAEGCTLKHDIAQDEPLTWDDIELPSGSVSARLYAEQQTHFQATFIGK
jgi:predicted homoserine dehydrogenase-like protein